MKYLNIDSATLLVDTGAQISFLKLQVIQNKHDINHSKVMKIAGAIAGIKCTTIGTLDSGIYIENKFYPHIFHVIDDHVAVGKVNGVIGSDFLRRFECKICFEHEIIELIDPDKVQRSIQSKQEQRAGNFQEKRAQEASISNLEEANLHNNLHDNVSVHIDHMDSNNRLSEKTDISEISSQISKVFWDEQVLCRKLSKFDYVTLEARTEN